MRHANFPRIKGEEQHVWFWQARRYRREARHRWERQRLMLDGDYPQFEYEYQGA